MYFLVTGTIKLSICFLYLRIFQNIRRPTILLIVVIGCATTAQVLCEIFECIPIAAAFDAVTPPGARCLDFYAFRYSAAAISVVTDIWALVLPIPTVWGRLSWNLQEIRSSTNAMQDFESLGRRR